MAPKVSFCLFCHNQAPFVAAALAGVFGQDYPDLEIIITDDASTDGTIEIVGEIVGRYPGPHRVVVRRHPVNVGLAEGLNQAMAVATGELIVVGAADDVSRPGRCRALVDAWLASGRRLHYLHSGFQRIDRDGRALELTADERARLGQVGPIEQRATWDHAIRYFMPDRLGATAAWSRTLFDRFGPLRSRVVMEEVVLGWRGLLSGGLLYLPEQLVDYRLHSHNVYHADIQLKQAGQTLRRDELLRLEAFSLRNLGFRPAIYDNFEADVASAARANLVDAATAATLATLIRQQRTRAQAQVVLRTAGLFARGAALSTLWKMDRRLAMADLVRILPRPVYERFRLAFHSFHRT
jgi:glycosyltransferase involved in cell wall biosynthesis